MRIDSKWLSRWFIAGCLLVMLASVAVTSAQDEPFPPAPIVNDEGGPVVVQGELTYSNPEFFLRGVAEPLVLLEDQAGFVDRNRYFLFPPESQTLGQFTSDFYQSPVSYSLALPMEPQGSYRDVDQDGSSDQGVQVFAVAYWSNIFGDPFLEERDMYGGGWSGAYASTRVSEDADDEQEIVGGKYIVYAPDDQQGFPSGFGADGRLFTEDDPIVTLPQGYTVVDLDTDPFTFSRERVAEIDLIEPSGAALANFSNMSYAEAFDALVAKMRNEYAFTEHKNIDWDALEETFRPRFEAADEEGDPYAYVRAFRDFVLQFPDGHMNAPFLREDFVELTQGGIGLGIRETDDGRVIANYITPGSPVDTAGIVQGAEILEINGQPIDDVIEAVVPYSGPFSAPHVLRLQQLRYATRFAVGDEIEVTFRNPGQRETQTATVQAVPEIESFNQSSFNINRTGLELPVEFDVLPSGYGIVNIYSLSDNELLTIQLWERMIQTMNALGVPGLIIDMRQNSGGSSFLTTQMAAYFFDEPLITNRSSIYDEERDEWVSDPRGDSRFYLPPEELRYHGPAVVLVGPNCLSACEFFSYTMTLQDRATIVGQYPSGGLGGGILSGSQVLLPEGIFFQFPSVRPLAADSDDIIIEGTGVEPTVKVPVNEDTLFSAGDPVLEAAEAYLDQLTGRGV